MAPCPSTTTAVADDNTCWADSATVEVDTVPYDRDDANGGSVRVWNITECKADFNNDEVITTADETAYNLWTSMPSGQNSYEEDFAGLEGGAPFHGDFDFSGTCCSAVDTARTTAFLDLGDDGCCITSEPSTLCPGDLNDDFDVDLTDLATLLGNFGTTDVDREDGDLDDDNDVDLNDLTQILSEYGTTCPELCPDPPSPLTGSVTIGVQAWDTGGYSGGSPAFDGEKWDFVFDVLVTINESADDWTGSGVRVTNANSAVFRLVPSPGNPPVPGSTVPEKYATFFSVPYAVNASSRFTSPFPTGGIAGRFTSSASGYTYTTSTLDAAWYDFTSSSNDGPAAVFRLVIDVENVSGADTSGGLGSVYWTTGSPGSGDIKVADMTFDVTHRYADSGASSVTGSFYVTD